MLSPSTLLEALRRSGVQLLTGVPCSLLPGVVEAAAARDDLRWVAATNEGDGVALAAGAELGGLGAAVLMQNSGLGNAVNPLSSLTAVFETPVLLLVTWRGEPGAAPDEPQHELMGAATLPLLDLLGIPHAPLPDDPAALAAALDSARAWMAAHRRPYALVVRRGVVGADPAGAVGTTMGSDRAACTAAPVHGDAARDGIVAARDGTDAARDETVAARDGTVAAPATLDPDAVLARVVAACADAVVVATTGLTGRALVALGERPNHLAMVGSMGCASSLALGLALARPERRVVVLDGDGAFLMRLGALAAVAREAPANLLHLLLDNGRHESTGGQPGLSAGVDACAVASGCGYPLARRVPDLAALQGLLSDPPAGPVFAHLITAPRTGPRPPRPTRTPVEAAEALRAWLAADD